MKTLKNSIYLAVPLIAILSSCSSGGSSIGNNQNKMNGDVVAQINGDVISKKQLEDRLTLQNQVMKTTEGQTNVDEKKRAALENLILEEIVLQEAKKDGVFQNSERLRREVMREYVQTKIGGGKEEPTDDEIKNLYESNKDTLDSIQARHILIKGSDNVALAKAKEILKKLKSQGENANFAQTASQISEDTATKDKGGDLGFFTYDKMVPAFSKAAFSLKNKKDISDVVKTEFGYHIIQLVEDRRGLENNKNSLRMSLIKDNKKKLYDDLMAELRKKATVKIDEDIVAKATASESIPTSR